MGRLAIAALATSVVAACIEPQTLRCGDLECPITDVCTPAGCATPENAAACAGHADHDACATSTIANGACAGERCHPIACGDGSVDPGEACDPPGPMCNATCTSTLACGNGITDPEVGEQCDDGNLRSSDGCSSTCQIERPTWTDITPQPIAPRFAMATVYDAALATTIVFGGMTAGGLVADTWRVSATGSQPIISARSPPARYHAAAVYDTARARAVLFGGANATPLGDTWEFDGALWTQIHPAHAPPPRFAASMIYDPDSARTILFGGGTTQLDVATGNLADTWAWDGSDWTELSPAMSPGPMQDHAMAYDSTRHVVVLFGLGATGGETWEFDGTTWLERVPATTTPTVAYGAAMVYDVGASRLLLIGGVDALGTTTSKMWSWDGSDWTQVTSSAFLGRVWLGAAYDPVAGATDLFGGLANSAPVGGVLDVDATGQFHISGCSGCVPPGAQHDGASFVYDARRGVLVVNGGTTRVDLLGLGTWGDLEQLDPSGWSFLPLGMLAEGRRDFGFVYDTARGRAVAVAGLEQQSGSTVVLGDVWELGDTAWTNPQPAVPLPPRTQLGATYETARARTLVFGGVDPNGAYRGDTWAWDGSAWTELTPARSPSARAEAQLAYDIARDRVVLFGGRDAAGVLGDTWEWDGVAWTLLAPATSPVARAGYGLVYDPQRRRVVLFGGAGELAGALDDAWEWDGTTWTMLAPIAPAPPRATPVVGYDPIRHELVRYGGRDLLGNLTDDVFALRWESAAPTERCLLATADDDGDGLAGCDDPDCWARCTPSCPPGAPCPAGAPRCGDGTCDAIEDRYICPQDCP